MAESSKREGGDENERTKKWCLLHRRNTSNLVEDAALGKNP